MVSLWYSDTYAKGMKEGEANVSEIAEDLSLDIEEVRSIEEAMEALHITCVNDETVERILAVLEAAPSGKA